MLISPTLTYNSYLYTDILIAEAQIILLTKMHLLYCMAASLTSIFVSHHLSMEGIIALVIEQSNKDADIVWLFFILYN